MMFKVIFASILGNLKLWLYGLGVAAIGAAVFFLRQSGADAEKLKQAKADAKAATTIGQKRAEAKAASDGQLKEGVSKWTRK